MNTTKLLEGNRVIIAGNPYLQGVSEKSRMYQGCQKWAKNGVFRCFLVQFSANFQQIINPVIL